MGAGLSTAFDATMTGKGPKTPRAIVSETLKVPARVWRAAFGGFLNTPDFTGDLAESPSPPC